MTNEWWILLAGSALNTATGFYVAYRSRSVNKREARDQEVDDRLDLVDENFASLRAPAKKNWDVVLHSSKPRRRSTDA